MSPDHAQNIVYLKERVDQNPPGTLVFDGFFPEFMVSPDMVTEKVRYAPPQVGAFEALPGRWIVRVTMRIRPEAIDYAHLVVGKAHGVKPRIRFPHHKS